MHTMRRNLAQAAVAGLSVLLLATAAQSAPTVTITSPAAGTIVSKSATPQFNASGTVAFAEPTADTATYFLRRDDCGGDDNQHLSIHEGSDAGSGCAFVANGIPNELANTVGDPPLAEDEYASIDGLPLTLDPTRNATGVLVLGKDGVGAGQATVDIRLTGQLVGSNEVLQLGSASVTKMIDPAGPDEQYEFSIDLPDEYDKQDLNALSLTYSVRGVTAYYGFIQLNGASYVDIPAYTASFDTPVNVVQVAMDNGAFSATGVVLSADGTSWSAVVSTPTSNGSRTLKVRAHQGNEAFASTPVTRKITVTA